MVFDSSFPSGNVNRHDEIVCLLRMQARDESSSSRCVCVVVVAGIKLEGGEK